jgi:hypothetical protein
VCNSTKSSCATGTHGERGRERKNPKKRDMRLVRERKQRERDRERDRESERERERERESARERERQRERERDRESERRREREGRILGSGLKGSHTKEVGLAYTPTKISLTSETEINKLDGGRIFMKLAGGVGVKNVVVIS